ncbi:hypothetical protein TTHERM_00467380 (macronuclear) [Tetrahymena thermophila SB210]|uniref:Uncharacterized protein n=1 Tax=Tetrahymena thermophila (strain SB210) TaxID=312017 RepID=I7MMG1_TETTS|nr:hypothetical protein TTHERM_00467380 [Tetrahymena thermophila SB210]EAS04789.1 hypothetical protein TTHERM_00467380 [Tetrahymena thermophila SB210]|eukprot:XP_001025034.1 hypothetical protein TTHERM_00467380 [Tetrahymena thermophila SB210]
MEGDYISQTLLHKKQQRQQELLEFQKNAEQAEEEVRKWNLQRESNLNQDDNQNDEDNIQYKENIVAYSNQTKNTNEGLSIKNKLVQQQSELEFPEEQIHQKLQKIRDLLGLNNTNENQNESSPIITKQKKLQQKQQIIQLEQERISQDDNYMEFANTFGKNDRINTDINLLAGDSQMEQLDFIKSNQENDDPISYSTSTFNRNLKQKQQNEPSNVQIGNMFTNQFRENLKNLNQQQQQEDNQSEQNIDTRRFLNEYINNFDNNFEINQQIPNEDVNNQINYSSKPNCQITGNQQKYQSVDVRALLEGKQLLKNENSFRNNQSDYDKFNVRESSLKKVETDNFSNNQRVNPFNKQRERSSSVNKSNNQSHNASQSFIDSGKKDFKNLCNDEYESKIPTTQVTQATSAKQNNTVRSLNQNIPNKFELTSMSYTKTEPSNRFNEYVSNNTQLYKKPFTQNITPSSRAQNKYEDRQNQSMQQIKNQSPFRATFQDKSTISHIGIADKQNTSLLNQSQIQLLENSNLNLQNATMINQSSNIINNQRNKTSFTQQYSPPQKLISEDIGYLESDAKDVQMIKHEEDEIRESNNNTERINNLFQQQVGKRIDQDEQNSFFQYEQQILELTNKNKSLMSDNIKILHQKEQLHKTLMKKESEITQLQLRVSDLEKKLEEKQDEAKLKRKLELAIQENTKELQQQIEELQKTISEQNFEIQNRTNQERFQRHKVSQQQNQFYLKEEELKNQVQFLKKEIENMKYNREILKNRGENEIKSRLLEMETDLHITRNQYHTLSQEKSLLEQQLEENQQISQQSLQKLEAEMQSAHQQEIQELQYFVISIKQEYEKLMLQIKNVKKPSKKKDSSQQQQTKKNLYNQQDKKQKVEDEEEEEENQEDLQTKIKQLIEEKNILHDEKFKLTQQVNWLSIKQKSQSYMEQKVETLMYERRFNQLTEMLSYWKKNCSMVCQDYLSQLAKLKKENEKLKSTIQVTQKRFLTEYESIVKEIAKKYQLESEQLHLNLKEMQQKYIQSQSKLAETRSKLKDVSQISLTNNTQVNSTIANQVFTPIDFSKITTEKKPPVYSRQKQNNSQDYSINFKQINQKILSQTQNQDQEKIKKKKKTVY